MVFRLISDLILSIRVSKLVLVFDSLVLILEKGMLGLDIFDFISKLEIFMLEVFELIKLLFKC